MQSEGSAARDQPFYLAHEVGRAPGVGEAVQHLVRDVASNSFVVTTIGC